MQTLTRSRALLAMLIAGVALTLLLPALASAATSDAPPLPQHELLTSAQLYAALFGALTPGVTYLLNHYAPWVSEPIKALVLALVAAAVGALTQLVDAGDLAFDTNTLQIVGTAVLLAFLAHANFWKPSGLAAKLKGGTNAQDPTP